MLDSQVKEKEQHIGTLERFLGHWVDQQDAPEARYLRDACSPTDCDWGEAKAEVSRMVVKRSQYVGSSVIPV